MLEAYSNAAIFKTREPERLMCYERPLDLRDSLILPPSQGSLSPNCCFSIGTECKALQTSRSVIFLVLNLFHLLRTFLRQ